MIDRPKGPLIWGGGGVLGLRDEGYAAGKARFFIGYLKGSLKKVRNSLAKCLAVQRQVLKETTYFILTNP